MEVAVFPISVTTDDEELISYEEPRALEIGVEFLDEWEWDYIAYDAKVRRTRLIVWDLELLACQAVPEEVDLKRLQIVEADLTGVKGRAECLPDGTVLRFVSSDGSAYAPRRWNSDVSGVVSNGKAVPRTEPEARAFHHDWMRSRLGHYP